MIQYEKIIDMNSFELKPEKYFFDEIKFYSYLKQKTVTKSDYQSSKFLSMNLKMRI